MKQPGALRIMYIMLNTVVVMILLLLTAPGHFPAALSPRSARRMP